MKKIGLSNGGKWVCSREDIEENADEIERLWNQIVNFMHDETREAVHYAIAPCSNADFLEKYLQLAPYDLIV